MGEFAKIAWLKRLFAENSRDPSLTLGIGDDAAIVTVGGEQWVFTVDACVQDVHFDWRWLKPADVGWRSFQAAASDVAAMGATPVAALSSIALPKGLSDDQFRAVLRGQAQASRQLNCPIIGGNLTSAGQLSIHTTVFGKTRRALRRDGAKPGDQLWLVGDVGAAAAGLHALRFPRRQRTRSVNWCIRKWQRPAALIAQGCRLQPRMHAGIDVSDGLAADLHHLTKASAVRAVLSEASLRSALDPRIVRTAEVFGVSPLDWALFGGEDYALVLAGSAHLRPAEAVAIGHVDVGHGVWLDTGQRLKPLTAQGFDHFR